MEQNYKNKEILVRKRMAAFLEKLLQHLGYDTRHDVFKQIVYNETACETHSKQKIKNYGTPTCTCCATAKTHFRKTFSNVFCI